MSRRENGNDENRRKKKKKKIKQGKRTYVRENKIGGKKEHKRI